MGSPPALLDPERLIVAALVRRLGGRVVLSADELHSIDRRAKIATTKGIYGETIVALWQPDTAGTEPKGLPGALLQPAGAIRR